MRLLDVNNIKTIFETDAGTVQAVRGVTFSIDKGEAVGIVGESGSGKSVTMLSVMGLIPENAKVSEGSIVFEGQEIQNKDDAYMRKVRGNDIGMIFQDPMTSLNPVLTVGTQIMEPLMLHQKLTKEQAKKKAIEMLKLVGIPSPESRLSQYPHEFSGGMRQRVMIAIALSCNPKLLIADEPTTALDVTIQAQILDLMKDLKDKLDTSIIMITHDLGVVATMCSRIVVMYGGTIVEQGTTRDIFYNPKHPYTWGLLKSIPNPDSDVKEPLIPIQGTPPDLLHPPVGCPFAPRCEYAMKVCLDKMPEYTAFDEKHKAACWLNHPDAPKVEREVK